MKKKSNTRVNLKEPKKRLNIPLVAIISVSLVVLTIIVIAIFATTFTGKVVNDYGKDCKAPYIKSDTGCCLDNNNNDVCDEKENLEVGITSMAFIGPPFQLRSIVIKSTGIDIVLKNKATDDYIIDTIELSSCTTLSPGTAISKNSENTYNMHCSLKTGEKYSGDIKITYRQGFTKGLISDGKIDGNVN